MQSPQHKQRIAFFSYPIISHILPYFKMFEIIKDNYWLDLYTCIEGHLDIEPYFHSVIRLKSMLKIEKDQLSKACFIIINHTSSIVEEIESFWAADEKMVPDIILCDFTCIYASIISNSRNIKCVSLLSIFLIDPDSLDILAEKTSTLPYSDTEISQMNEEEKKIENKYNFKFRRTKNGKINMIEFGSTEFRISHSPKNYPYAWPLLPDLKLLGPLFRVSETIDFDFTSISKNKKVIYFSLGTLY